MPTGYTIKIKEGQEFEDFVLGCSRAFGALVQMRDDPSDANIPNEIKSSEFHKNAIVGCEILLKNAKILSLEDAGLKAKHEYDNKLSEYDIYNKNKTELKTKYEDMLDKVNKWQPPSPEHVGLKQFMVEQIVVSVEHDCTIYPFDYEMLTPGEWMQKNIDDCARKLGYHVKEWDVEVKRCNERTKWIQDLKKSLNV